MTAPGRRRTARTAGLLGAVVGVAAAGIAGGIAVQRRVVRRGLPAAPDPYADEPFGELPADQVMDLSTPEGARLHVEVVEPPGPGGPALTVLFVHGLALDMGTFHFQRTYLTGLAEPLVRGVYYDQPLHGRSGGLPDGRHTIDALGVALFRVIEEVAPDGPIVLVGHSMGAMSMMALAEQHPDLFGPGGRIQGVALISTSAGQLADVPFGLPGVLTGIRRRLMPVITGAAKLTPAMIDRARGAATDLSHLLTRRFGFGGPTPSRALVSYVERMNGRTSVGVIAGFMDTLFAHTRYAALAALAETDVLVVAGDSDLFTPLAHTEAICRLLPDAELLVVPDAGHVALLESHEVINPRLHALLSRAARQTTRDRPGESS